MAGALKYEIPQKPAEGTDPEAVVVEMQHLKKSFGGNHVLKDINLRITKGENVVVLGKSGSGKSVLIKCLVRLL
jgi:phospholipid/cholesterol/gamma-HCH transport system ATP-binding protein